MLSNPSMMATSTPSRASNVQFMTPMNLASTAVNVSNVQALLAIPTEAAATDALQSTNKDRKGSRTLAISMLCETMEKSQEETKSILKENNAIFREYLSFMKSRAEKRDSEGNPNP